jgi:hypothetical protein
MKTTSNSLIEIALVVGISFFGSFGSQMLSPQPAQAITWPEVGKVFGIWSRYIEDIQKTMYDQPQPNPQPTPSIDPQAPTAPPSNDLNQEFESIITQ